MGTAKYEHKTYSIGITAPDVEAAAFEYISEQFNRALERSLVEELWDPVESHEFEVDLNANNEG